MTGLRHSVLENEKMQKARGVVLLLPGKVHLRARLTFLYVRYKVSDCFCDLSNRRPLHLVTTRLIDRHDLSFSSRGTRNMNFCNKLECPDSLGRKPLFVLSFHASLGPPKRPRSATGENVRQKVQMRVPSAGHADHLSKVPEATLRYDQ